MCPYGEQDRKEESRMEEEKKDDLRGANFAVLVQQVKHLRYQFNNDNHDIEVLRRSYSIFRLVVDWYMFFDTCLILK